MKRYETIFIVDPDLSKEAEVPIFERVHDLIPQYKGFLIKTDDWGTKKLAYDIKKKNRGRYVRLDYCGDGALIQEMERLFRIDDKVMKFMTVLLDGNADLDAIKADLAEKKAAEEQATAEEAAVKEQATTEEPAVKEQATAEEAAVKEQATAEEAAVKEQATAEEAEKSVEDEASTADNKPTEAKKEE